MTVIERDRLRDALLLARDRAGLTQRQLAARLGVSRPAVTQWESGDTVPTAWHLERLDNIFGEGWR
jgi:transcriptional regulator with XRE-family HTH domain